MTTWIVGGKAQAKNFWKSMIGLRKGWLIDMAQFTRKLTNIMFMCLIRNLSFQIMIWILNLSKI